MRTLPFIAAALLAGCAASEWSKPGGSPESLATETELCKGKALDAVPIKMQMISTGWEQPPRRECTGGDKPVCTTTPGVPAAPRLLDVNEVARKKAVDACLRAIGWSK